MGILKASFSALDLRCQSALNPHKVYLHVLFLFLSFMLFLPPLQAATGKKVMAVTADPRATAVALDVLKNGGNAVDAAIAAQWMLNVVEPQSSGIGGGGFFLFYEAESQRIYAFDGREKAPGEAFPEMFMDEKTGKPFPYYPDRITGGLPVGVPGTLRLLEEVYDRFGSKKFSFGELFIPAIDFASGGIEISDRLAYHIQREADRLKRFKASKNIFFNHEEKPLKAGQILFQPDLANTFRLIQQKGISVFYEGEIADDIVKAVRESPHHPGLMKKEDLFYYEVVERLPVYGHYRGYDIFSMGPPSSGGTTLIEALHILEGYPMSLHGRSVQGLHLFAEAQKLAFQDRNKFIGDPAYSDVPTKKLTSKVFAKMRAELISPDEVVSVTEDSRQGGMHTSHMSIVDGWGNMVSFTTTIESVFGSGMVVSGRGFVLNNELTDFDAEPYVGSGKKKELHPNAPEGDKRPRSSMTPTFVFKKGKPYLIVGTPGGSTIIGTVLNIIVNVIDFGMSLEKAMAAARVINRNGATEMETLLFQDESTKFKLQQKGHDLTHKPVIGNAQAIYFDPENDMVVGVSDPRGEGVARGF